MILTATLALAPVLAKDNEPVKTAGRSFRGVLGDHGNAGLGHPARNAGECSLHRNRPWAQDRCFLGWGEIWKRIRVLSKQERSCLVGAGRVRIEGESVGFQLGGSQTDLIMLVMNERGAGKLLSSKFTLGAEGSVAAGPVGRTATAQTDGQMHAEILSWSRSGLFAGLAGGPAAIKGRRKSRPPHFSSSKHAKPVVFYGTAGRKEISRSLDWRQYWPPVADPVSLPRCRCSQRSRKRNQ
jgi:hypothetical protein